MGRHFKGPKVNWLEKAWDLAVLFENMPSAPPSTAVLGFLARVSHSQREALQGLAMTISHHMAYRMRTYYKVIPIVDGKKGAHAFTWGDPERLLLAYRDVAQMGAQFTITDWMAIDAQIKLATVLLDGFISPDWKRELPLIVASIGGPPISRTASSNAAQLRGNERLSPLACAVAAARKSDPHATCAEVLHDLENNCRDVVKEIKDGRIHYFKGDGTVTDIGLDRFENIFSEQKPSTG